MRLWDYRILPFLPNSQLLAQWRELNSIFKNHPNHILINYVYDYPKIHLYSYTFYVLREMDKRGMKVRSLDAYIQYFEWPQKCETAPFPNHHTDRYLLQCFYNLQEKYDRGQKDFPEELYKALVRYISWSCPQVESVSKLDWKGEWHGQKAR